MAKGSALASIQISLVLLLAIFVCSEANHRDRDYCCGGKETKITVYLQLFSGGPNATTVAVAGAPGRPRTPTEFGTIYVNDSPFTESISINSPTVGRSQGLYVASSRDGLYSFDPFSFIFTDGQYNGSTLEFQGLGYSIQNTSVTEFSVLSGTKIFRYVRGYATFLAVRQIPARNYTVTMANITIRRC